MEGRPRPPPRYLQEQGPAVAQLISCTGAGVGVQGGRELLLHARGPGLPSKLPCGAQQDSIN